jgi:hypothetical protein
VSDDQFSQPIQGDKFEAAQYEGSLLLFYVTEFQSSVETTFGDTCAADTHIVVLKNNGQALQHPEQLRDARVFGNLAKNLKGGAGGKAVLGVLGRGPNTKGNAPWILLPFGQEDADLARGWMGSNSDPREPQVQGPPTSGASVPTATVSVQGGSASRDPQVVAQLAAKGVDVSKLPPSADLGLILQSLG